MRMQNGTDTALVDYDLVESPDDGGWYCEVFDPLTGRTLHLTKVYATSGEAERHALSWIQPIAD